MVVQLMLTEKECRALEPQGKPYRKHDAKGLYLEIPPVGAKRWRLQYQIDGKRNQKSLGVYPEVSLRQAKPKEKLHRPIMKIQHRACAKGIPCNGKALLILS